MKARTTTSGFYLSLEGGRLKPAVTAEQRQREPGEAARQGHRGAAQKARVVSSLGHPLFAVQFLNCAVLPFW